MLSLAPFLSYVFVTTFTPGPNNIMSMTNANQYGFKKSIRFILGVSAGFAVIMLLCSYFNLLLFNIIPKIKLFMGILGAFYMLYLAYKTITGKPGPDSSEEAQTNTFISGMALQFINPKVILYGITVISNFIIPNYKTNISLVAFSLFLAFVGFLSTSCWALFGALFQKVLSEYRRAFNLVMGGLLIYSAISVLL